MAMAQSRSYFLKELQRMGFESYTPKGDIYKYIPKDYFKLDNIVTCISPKGNAIEITVYEILLKTFYKFQDYSSAWAKINDLLKQPVKSETAITEFQSKRIKRKGTCK